MWDLDYLDLYKFSIEYPEKFWDEIGKEVVWTKPYTSVLEDKHCPRQKWFVGGELNMSYNCLDKQIEDGYGDDVAVIYDSYITKTVQKLTYNDILTPVERLAGVLKRKCCVNKGDRVVIYFPRIPQCLIAMLACARIGAVSVTVYAGSPVNELVSIIKHTKPSVIITTNVGLEPKRVVNYKDRIDSAIEHSGHSLNYCIVYDRPNYPPASLHEGRDLEWFSEIQSATPQGPIPVESDHPHYILYTSGTTGSPKGIVRLTGASVVSNMYSMKHLINLRPGEVWWMISDFSWTLGQTLLSYGPLMTRNPTILFEGPLITTDDLSQMMRVVNEHEVVSLFTIPTTMRHLHKFASDSDLKMTSNHLQSIILGGELSNVALKEWISERFHCKTYEIWGQTEIGDNGIMQGGKMKGYEKYWNTSITGLLMPSFNAKIVDRETGEELPNGNVGRLILKLPVGPSLLPTIYQDDERCFKTYFQKYPGYYDTMDAAVLLGNGAIKIISRDDDTIEVSAANISAGAVEHACLLNDRIISATVVAMEDEIKGFVPFGFLVVKNENIGNEIDLLENVFELVSETLGNHVCFNNAIIVSSLPRSRSGKIAKHSLTQMINGKKCEVLPTIDNPDSYFEIYDELIRAGYKSSKPLLV